MTCKDCLHYDVCKMIDFKMEYYNKSQLECETEMCDKFQDKSKFIELPCKVGDKVYVVYNIYALLPFEKLSDRIKYKIEEATMNSIPMIVELVYGFGAFIFHTKEEAEAKLNELDN